MLSKFKFTTKIIIMNFIIFFLIGIIILISFNLLIYWLDILPHVICRDDGSKSGGGMSANININIGNTLATGGVITAAYKLAATSRTPLGKVGVFGSVMRIGVRGVVRLDKTSSSSKYSVAGKLIEHQAQVEAKVKTGNHTVSYEGTFEPPKKIGFAPDWPSNNIYDYIPKNIIDDMIARLPDVNFPNGVFREIVGTHNITIYLLNYLMTARISGLVIVLLMFYLPKINTYITNVKVSIIVYMYNWLLKYRILIIGLNLVGCFINLYTIKKGLYILDTNFLPNDIGAIYDAAKDTHYKE